MSCEFAALEGISVVTFDDDLAGGSGTRAHGIDAGRAESGARQIGAAHKLIRIRIHDLSFAVGPGEKREELGTAERIAEACRVRPFAAAV